MKFFTMIFGRILFILSFLKVSKGLDSLVEYRRKPAEFTNVDFNQLLKVANGMSRANQIPDLAALDRYQSSIEFGNVSEKCLDSLKEYAKDLTIGKEPRPYAFQMDYTSGHLPENIVQTFNFTWSLKFKGYLSMCRSIELPAGLSFTGTRYCLFNSKISEGVNLMVGKCLPASCSEGDIYEFLNSLPGVDEFELLVHCAEIPPLSTGAICTLVLSGVIVVLIISATLYDYWVRSEQNSSDRSSLSEKKEEPSNNVNNGVKSAARPRQNGELTNSSPPPEKKQENFAPASMCRGASEGETNIQSQIEEDPSSFGKHRSVSQMQLVVEEPDWAKTQSGPGILKKLLLSFSFLTNSSKLLSTNQPGNMRALNGIRVLSMFWVILGHTVYYMTVNPVYLDNVKTVLDDFLHVFGSQIFWNAFFSVETFFFLSGFLVAYFTILELNKRGGKINWFLFIFHRYWRLTPIYAFVILIYLFVVPYFGIGPHTFYNFTPGFTGPCQNYWWTNLLYINNLYPYPGSLGEQCIGWSWYLANDFQLFVISPIFTYLLYKNWKVGLFVTIFFVLCGIGATAWTSFYYGEPVGLDFEPYNDNQQTPGDDVLYGKPWSHLPVYLVGVIMGWLVYYVDSNKITIEPFLQKNKIPAGSKKVLVTFGWCCSAAVALACLFGIWSTAQGERLPQWQAVLYEALCRVSWAIAMAWLVFACIRGYAGPVNQFLSWEFWIPMARLTYGAYLIHSIVILSYYWTLDQPVYIEYYSVIYIFLGHTIISYTAAFFVSMAVEIPMAGIEKILLRKSKR